MPTFLMSITRFESSPFVLTCVAGANLLLALDIIGSAGTMSPTGLDEALVAASQGGSTEAFARLVERHQQALRAFLRRTCGDWASADDLAQETFLCRLVADRPPGRQAPACAPGSAASATTSIFDGPPLLRRARPGAGGELYEAAHASPPQVGPEDRLSLEDAMASLPAEQRACVALCLAADFSHAEAAAGARPAARHREEPCVCAAARACCKPWEMAMTQADDRLKALFAHDEPVVRDPAFAAGVMALAGAPPVPGGSGADGRREQRPGASRWASPGRVLLPAMTALANGLAPVAAVVIAILCAGVIAVSNRAVSMLGLEIMTKISPAELHPPAALQASS